jgi:RNA polymerase sigma-70 factor, ECF subfamily
MTRRDIDSEARRTEFEATAVPFMGALYNTARRLMHGDDDAADLVQETYLRAFRTFDSYTPGTNCRGWLLTIMYSVFINHYHKTRRQAFTISIDDLEGRLQRYLESADDPAATISMVDVRGSRSETGTSGESRVNPEVDSALRALPEEFRVPVLLVDVEGLSYDEAAEVMDCPVGTIRSRLYRGRRLLFASLKDYAASLGFRRSGT